MTDAPVLIAGAGVAGLVTALALSRRGIAVRILERAPAFEEIGAGIQLSANATRLLDGLGILSALKAKAVEPVSITLRRASDLAEIGRLPIRQQSARWRAPYLTIHRADLQAALVAAVQERSDITIETGITVAGCRETDRGVAVAVAEGGRTMEGSCLVGADGVWSALRGAAEPARAEGSLAWRATIPAAAEGAPAAGLSVSEVTTYLANGVHLVAYPVSGGAAFNMVAFTRGARGGRSWSAEGDKTELMRRFVSASAPLRRLLQAVAAWTVWPLYAVSPDAPWRIGRRTILIGDAAHAMTPFAAQGAAMAIEDAVMLAALLAPRPDEPDAAFRRFEALRRPRVRRVAQRGAFNRFAWHAAGPLAFGRDVILGLRGGERLLADLDWLYGYDALAAVSGGSG